MLTTDPNWILKANAAAELAYSKKIHRIIKQQRSAAGWRRLENACPKFRWAGDGAIVMSVTCQSSCPHWTIRDLGLV
jgi:hypothetical protein